MLCTINSTRAGGRGPRRESSSYNGYSRGVAHRASPTAGSFRIAKLYPGRLAAPAGTLPARVRTFPMQSDSDRRLGELVAQLKFSKPPPSPAAAAAAAAAGTSQRKITAVLVGAGNRGSTYTTYALENPELVQVRPKSRCSESVHLRRPSLHQMKTPAKSRGLRP